MPQRGKRRDRRGAYDPRRNMGCIVTAAVAREGGGVDYLVRYEPGKTLPALRRICDALPEGAWVETVSTYRTIERDLSGEPRLVPFQPSKGGANPRLPNEPYADPWQVERAMLGRIQRLDLLPERRRHPSIPKTTLQPRRFPRAHFLRRFDTW